MGSNQTTNPPSINNPETFSSHLVRELEATINDLQVEVRSNKVFLNMVIHDMRNPTNAIEFGIRQTIETLETDEVLRDKVVEEFTKRLESG